MQAPGHGEQFPIAPYVSSTEAVSIGLIVTELVINALKHAFGQPPADGVMSRTVPHGRTVSIVHSEFPARLLKAA